VYLGRKVVSSNNLLVWSLEVKLFIWAIEGYNRLVRLCSHAIAALSALVQAMARLTLLMEANFTQAVSDSKRFADGPALVRADLNRRVQLYDGAIGPFPALLLASAARLKPGQVLS
jgi:hypothetical protein